MSKTDKTKPWAVRVMEHRPWADHDHRNGVCDLPAHYRDNRYGSRRVDGEWVDGAHCRWSDWNICYDGCCHGCACRLCSQRDERRWKTRRDRHRAKSQNRAMRKVWRELD